MVEEEPITITAWYTPQIPGNMDLVSTMDSGLILEVNDGSCPLCSKLVLNPESSNQGTVVQRKEAIRRQNTVLF